MDANLRTTAVPPRKVLAARGVEITILSGSGANVGHTIIEYKAPPGFRGVQPHWHEVASEWFYVLSGTMACSIENEDILVPSGGFIQVPPRVVHFWWNHLQDEGLHFVFGYDRPGMERYFEELLTFYSDDANWPPSNPSFVRSLGERYDTFAGTP